MLLEVCDGVVSQKVHTTRPHFAIRALKQSCRVRGISYKCRAQVAFLCSLFEVVRSCNKVDLGTPSATWSGLKLRHIALGRETANALAVAPCCIDVAFCACSKRLGRGLRHSEAHLR